MFISRFAFSLTEGVRLKLLGKFLFGAAVTLTYITQVFLLSRVLMIIYEKGHFENLLPFLIGLILLVGLRSLLIRGDILYGKSIIGDVKNRLRERCYQKLLRLGPGCLSGERTGKVQADMMSGIDYLEGYLTQYFPQALLTMVSGTLYILYMMRMDLRLGLVVLLSYLTAAFSPLAFRNLLSRSSNEHWESFRALTADILDSIQGMDMLKMYALGEEQGKQLGERMRQLMKATMRNLRLNVSHVGVANFATGIGVSFTLGLGALLMLQGELSVSQLMILLFFTAEIFRPLNTLSKAFHEGFMGYTASETIHRFLQTEEEIGEEGVEELSDSPLSIAFEQVDFAYEGSTPLFESFGFQVKAGEHIALVGESGSGKTSIFHLLMRFYEVRGGRILIGGKDIRSLKLQELRRRIALVSQDTYLFHGTIEENLRMAKPQAGEEELRAAARAANIDSFISSLPEGYSSRVGERGVNFSGGQRQRLSIARAILKGASIILLDEATSSVDEENEKEIQSALKELLKGRTTITIAHRLNTIEEAERILVLKEGRITETGSHQELMRRQGDYCRLLKAQMRGGVS
ncbi:MAG: ABC transporter ATP-binding protein [Peptostreptococcaceae bacterium]|nr:ABC transporter ATP-binding protein [Peptostreptococcaceae bacterium]